MEVERFSKVNKELSTRNRHLQKQLYNLVEEKSDLQANMQNQQIECQDLQVQLSAAVKENMDLSCVEVIVLLILFNCPLNSKCTLFKLFLINKTRSFLIMDNFIF